MTTHERAEKKRKRPVSVAIRILDRCFYLTRSISGKSLLWSAKMHLQSEAVRLQEELLKRENL